MWSVYILLLLVAFLAWRGELGLFGILLLVCVLDLRRE